MKYQDALTIAKMWKAFLAPFCDRIEIAGSIRREKSEVKDIELLCIPSLITGKDLFNQPYSYRNEAFAEFFAEGIKNDQILVLKGSPRDGKYVQVFVKAYNIKIDVFIATPDNWGYLLAIRTGSVDYSHKVLANAWVKAGYHGQNGYLIKWLERVPVREEKDLFDLIGLDYIEPKYREWTEK